MIKAPTRHPLSRRAVLTSATALAAAPASAARAQKAKTPTDAQIQKVLERYQGFGDKASGGPGDEACGEWLIGELSALGYRCRRQTFEAPGFRIAAADLSSGSTRAALLPQAIPVTTPIGGLRGRLYLAGAQSPPTGTPALAIVVLPHRRWSTAAGFVERQVNAHLAAGAAGAVVVTTGPTGSAVALNAPADAAIFPKPVAILAPRDAEPFLEAASRGDEAVLRIEGETFRRPAFNVLASLPRGSSRRLVISTPRSGWFGCAGERGPGLAVWLALARWAAERAPRLDVELVCTSGHEYENLGGRRFLESAAPPPAETALWLHLGANVAARDWHEAGAALGPLPSCDPQRFLMATPDLLEGAKTAFAGQPGLEQPYPANAATAAGEFAEILRVGYPSALGIFGAHRYHHTRQDDLRCVLPQHVRLAAGSLMTLLEGRLS